MLVKNLTREEKNTDIIRRNDKTIRHWGRHATVKESGMRTF